jgi:hypothetical protein
MPIPVSAKEVMAALFWLFNAYRQDRFAAIQAADSLILDAATGWKKRVDDVSTQLGAIDPNTAG